MIVRPRIRRWLPLVGAAVAFVLVTAACGDAAPATTTAAVPQDDATTTTVTNQADPTSLGDALAAMGTRYAFDAAIILDGVEVTTVEGMVYDGIGSYVVSAGGSDVEYVVSDQGQWAREPGNEWAPLAGPAPLRDPLTPLTTPLSTSIVDTNATDSVVEAVYDGSTLGFASNDDVTVTIRIVGGVIESITYEASVADGIATVITRFDPTAAVESIKVPPT